MWGNKLKVSVFGESHGQAIGVVIDGLEPGIAIDMKTLEKFQARRTAKGDGLSTARREPDKAKIISGLYKGITTGAPLTAVIENTDIRSEDYDKISGLLRPGHADYTAFLRYQGFADMRGSGHFSGRLTAPLVLAGGICKQILKSHGITVGAHLYSIGDICDQPIDAVTIDAQTLEQITDKEFPLLDSANEAAMKEQILTVKREGDSIGGVIECCAVGLPGGLGSPMFEGVENIISSAIFAVPAVKGIEFGAGFEAARLTGSQNNDEFYICDGQIRTRTNLHGGILGGITTGMPLLFRVAVKPTPSIYKDQNTVDILRYEQTRIQIKGRHDPCIAVRAVPCIEAVAAIALTEVLYQKQKPI